jgi:ethanolamine ammonia-lyase small subunit
MDSWHSLRAFTQARIALGSAGSAVRTQSHLDFQLAHAESRDAVWKDWDYESFVIAVQQQSASAIHLETQAETRTLYLQRPDLGRCLKPESLATLMENEPGGHDLALIVSNGLSTTSVERHALPFLNELMPSFKSWGINATPILVVPNGRVALSDEIGVALRTRASLILIGERPGLSAADSLGAYITLTPARKNTDAQRNCLSNIREPDGLAYRTAADKICYLILKGFRLGLGGVALKDDSPDDPALLAQSLLLMTLQSSESGKD